jgi:hypothetical protein
VPLGLNIRERTSYDVTLYFSEKHLSRLIVPSSKFDLSEFTFSLTTAPVATPTTRCRRWHWHQPIQKPNADFCILLLFGKYSHSPLPTHSQRSFPQFPTTWLALPCLTHGPSFSPPSPPLGRKKKKSPLPPAEDARHDLQRTIHPSILDPFLFPPLFPFLQLTSKTVS